MTITWTVGSVPEFADAEVLHQGLADLAHLPTEAGVSLATLVVYDGQIVGEQYGPTVSAQTPLISWSMAKSVTQALLGECVARGLLYVDQPAPVAAWANDERAGITIEHLLQMRSGLAWNEDYVDAGGSDVIEMLFGAGMPDTAAFAAAKPLEATPGTRWKYSSGTTNILARIITDAVGGTEEAFELFWREVMLDPLGMSDTTARFDPAGTFVGSSFVYSTARDFARFGELYRLGGRVGDQQVLSSEWVARAGRDMPVAVPDEESFGYADHWWTWGRAGFPDVFAAHGYEGQRICVSSARKLVVVQLSKNPADQRYVLDASLKRIISAFPTTP